MMPLSQNFSSSQDLPNSQDLPASSEAFRVSRSPGEGNALAGKAEPPPLLSVVSPCYNEAGGIAALHARLSAACRDAAGQSYEIILVDDGSRDATWPAIAALSGRDPRLFGVRLARNHGHQLAVTAGLSLARGERVLLIDADLQDPPELLPRMMRMMDDGADVVYGRRVSRRSEGWFKRGSASLFYRLLRRLTEIDIPADTGDFRLMSRRVVDALQGMPERHRFIRGMVSWIGFVQVPLDYDRGERFAGETKYPFSKMLRFALDAVTSFSTTPLRLASHIGLLTAFAALLVLAYSLVQWVRGEAITGWTSLIATVLLLGSIQLFVLGIMGEYLGRLLTEAKQRPLFLIDAIATQRGQLAVPVHFAKLGRPEQREVWVSTLSSAAPAAGAPTKPADEPLRPVRAI